MNTKMFASRKKSKRERENYDGAPVYTNVSGRVYYAQARRRKMSHLRQSRNEAILQQVAKAGFSIPEVQTGQQGFE